MDTNTIKVAAPGQPPQQQGGGQSQQAQSAAQSPKQQQQQAPAGSPDQQFEQGFFQLAYDKLQSKLYNLLPYMVGFEIVNKAQDGTKAVGVFGFKSDNGQILYVPAFFINGKVKDLDVMYSRNNNQFYPLTEDFAELFLKDDVTGLGGVSEQGRQEVEKQTPSTDMRDLVLPPRTGRISYASVVDFIAEGDDQIKAAAWDIMSNSPEFTEALTRFYTKEELATALRPQEKTAQHSLVEVLTKEQAPAELKPKAMSKGYVVVDRREDKQKTRYGLVNYTSKFTQAEEPGFYSYLTESGTLRYGLYLRPRSLYAGFDNTTGGLIIDLQATHPGQCFLLSEGRRPVIRETIKIEDYTAVHKKMEDAVEGKPSFDRAYVLVDEQLNSVGPFRIKMNYRDDSDLRRLKVEPTRSYDYDDCCAPISCYGGVKGTGHERSKVDWKGINSIEGAKEESRPVTLVFTKKENGKLEYRGALLYVPKGYKLMEIRTETRAPWTPSPVGETEEQYKKRRAAEDKETERIRSARPGTLFHLTSFLREQGVLPLSVRSNGSELFATVGAASKKYDDPIKAKIGMILDFGLSEEDAETLVDKAAATSTPLNGVLKLAYTGDFTHTPQDEAPTYNELGQPTYYGIPYQHVAPTDDSYTGDPTRQGLGVTAGPQSGDYQSTSSQANQLAQNGQKEIFDTHAIAMISKYVDPTSKVTSYLPNFVDTLDKLGRMLFLVYWETDKFQKMYGIDDLPELIELIKNVFKNLGDLVIFLKRKFPDLSINTTEQDASEG